MTARRSLGRTRILILLVSGAAASSGCSPEGAIIGGAVGAAVVGGQAPTQEIQQIYYLGIFDPLEQLPPSVYRITVHGQGSFISQTKFASGWVPAAIVDTLNDRIGFTQDGRLTIEGDPTLQSNSQDAQTPAAPPQTSADPEPGDESPDKSASDDGTQLVGNKASVVVNSGNGTANASSGSVAAREQSRAQLQTSRRLVLFGPEGFREAPRDHRLVIVMGGDPSKFFQAVGESMVAVADIQREQDTSEATQRLTQELLRLRSQRDRLSDLRLDLARSAG
jgi:hypothetical protein